MVKKRLRDGNACGKCDQAEAMLRGRGLWGRIDEVVWAVEGDASSDGMRLGAAHGVELAPFFIVRQGEEERIVHSTLKLMRHLNPPASAENVQEEPPQVPADVRAEAPVSADAADDALAAFVDGFSAGDPVEAMRQLLSRHGRDCAIAFSGAEDVVLIDMAVKTGLPFSVFCLDTGRLHAETYRFIDRVRAHYGIEIRLMSPEAEALQVFVARKGLYSFYEDGHKECCNVRKIEPLRRALSGYSAWITGQRRDQSPTRADVPTIQIDGGFQGKDGPLLKLNPLAEWSSAQVWSYIRQHAVPYNELHERGFVSIGCEPCTRPVGPGQHEREGRWWWEEATQRECGLHVVQAPEAAVAAQ